MLLRNSQLKDGRKLCYREIGKPDGQPVFYFHGAPSSSAEAGMIEKDLLFKYNLRVIAPDRPGCGASDPLAKRTFMNWAEDVLELADHLNLQKFSIIGNSCGGAYVAACCIKFPQRLRSAVILAGAWRMDHPIAKKHLTFPYSTFWFSVKRGPIFLPGIISSIFYTLPVTRKFMPFPDSKVLHKGRFYAFLAAVEGAMQNKFGASWDLMMYTKTFDFDVSSVTFPILLLHGEKDKNVPVELVKFFSKSLFGSTLIIFKKEAHFSIVCNQFERAAKHISDSHNE